MYLLLAGICEIGWAVGLKFSEGFTRPAWSIFTAVLMVLSYVLLSQAMKAIPLGTAYAIWTGIGAAGVAIIGMLFLHEPASWIRIGSLMLIVGGIVGLKLAAP